MPRYSDIRERLIANSVMDDASPCWHWTGEYSGKYGKLSVRVNGRHTKLWAHRVAYEVWNGPIPESMTVEHVCRTTSCINPGHLTLLTRADNSKMMRAIYCKRCA